MRPNFVAFAGAIATTFVCLAGGSAAVADDLSFTFLDLADIPAAAARAPGYMPGTHLCSIQAYLGRTGRGGAHLRGGPGQRFSTVGRLPGPDSEGTGPSFQIIGSRSGWFLIRNPFRGGGAYGKLTRLYGGSAWIASRLIAFSMEGDTLYSAPRLDAPVRLRLRGSEEEWRESDVTVERIHGCSGGFLDITVRKGSGRGVRGWFAAICGVQQTLCGFGDNPVLVEERGGKLISTADLD